MSLPPFPPFTLPFRAFLFDLHPIATATQQRRYFFSLFFFPLSLRLLFFSLLPPASPNVGRRFFVFSFVSSDPLSRARGSSSMARTGNVFECPPRCGTVSFPVFNSRHCRRVPSLLSVHGRCFAFLVRWENGRIFRGNLRLTSALNLLSYREYIYILFL